MRPIRGVAAVLRAVENATAVGLLAVICGVTAAQVVVQIFLLCLLKFGVDLLIRIGDQRSSGLQIQIFWVYLALPVSAVLMLVHSVPILGSLLAESRGADGRRA